MTVENKHLKDREIHPKDFHFYSLHAARYMLVRHPEHPDLAWDKIPEDRIRDVAEGYLVVRPLKVADKYDISMVTAFEHPGSKGCDYYYTRPMDENSKTTEPIYAARVAYQVAAKNELVRRAKIQIQGTK